MSYHYCDKHGGVQDVRKNDYRFSVINHCHTSTEKLQKLQKTAVRNISLAHYNSHTGPLFKKYKILKFDDLVTISVGSFMFNVSMGNQPNTISEVFNKNVNFNRNLDFILERVPYSYLHKIVPYSQVKIWNQIHSGHRNWLKEKPEQVMKSLLAPPKKSLKLTIRLLITID